MQLSGSQSPDMNSVYIWFCYSRKTCTCVRAGIITGSATVDPCPPLRCLSGTILLYLGRTHTRRDSGLNLLLSLVEFLQRSFGHPSDLNSVYIWFCCAQQHSHKTFTCVRAGIITGGATVDPCTPFRRLSGTILLSLGRTHTRRDSGLNLLLSLVCSYNGALDTLQT